MGVAMSGIIIDKIKGILDEFEDADLGIESNRELIALVIYRELLDDFIAITHTLKKPSKIITDHPRNPFGFQIDLFPPFV